MKAVTAFNAFHISPITGRNDSQGHRQNYQQNRQGFGHQQSRFDNRQGGQQGRQDNQSRFSNAAPPKVYHQNQQRDGFQQRPPHQSGSSSSHAPQYQNNRPPQQGGGSSGGYQQWKAQRGGFGQSQRGHQSSRGGYQRFNSEGDQQQRYFSPKPDKIPGPPSSRYGGSYSRE